MANRNINASVQALPTSHLPRTKFNMPFFHENTSAAHGYLFPFFCKVVYPTSTWELKSSQEILKENSIRVPLDSIYHDTYFFYVPLRILDDNWKKVLGDTGDPYDTNIYGVPSFTYYPNGATGGGGGITTSGFTGTLDQTTFQLPFYMRYGCSNKGTNQLVKNKLSCYPIWAYWKIWNFYFRDENLQPVFDFKTKLANGSTVLGGQLTVNGLASTNTMAYWNALSVAPVSRYHDYFSNGTLSPQRGPDVLMHLDNELIPVGITGPGNITTPGSPSVYTAIYGPIVQDQLKQLVTVSGQNMTSQPIIADATGNGISIEQFRVAMMTQALYERKNMFGTRYDEYLRGVWGENVPASLISEPEYLGGERIDLASVPVFGTSENNTGIPAGTSQTGALAGQVFKTFTETGFIIGVHCFRVKHTYGQGFENFWQKFDELDFYNPIFANLGFQPRFKKEIYNTGELNVDSTYNIPEGDLVWNYNEAWIEERIYNDGFSGLFDPSVSDHLSVLQHYTYADVYDTLPTFSSYWLQEPLTNVIRTLTGDLIPNSTQLIITPEEGDPYLNTYALPHQYLCRFGFSIKKVMSLPAHSKPVTLTGRL